MDWSMSPQPPNPDVEALTPKALYLEIGLLADN